MKWGRFMAFLVMVAVVIGLTVGTAMPIAKKIPLGLDLRGGVDLLYQIQPSSGQHITESGKQALLQAVELRVNNLGVASPIIDLEGRDQIRVQLAGVKDQAAAAKTIGETAQLAMYSSAKMDPKTGAPIAPAGKLLATGADLKSNASYVQDPNTGKNEVAISFKDPKKWENITSTYLGKPIYIFLNDNLLTDPVINEKMFTGDSVIYGPQLTTPQECQQLASQINAGALPYPLHLQSETSVGPSLGQASLQATLYAGMIAIILIFLFMIVLYRMAGLIADIALVAYGYLTILIFNGLHVVLTLSGLAALVLGVGMAVDANIITYERIKDEMRQGRSLRSAVKIGNKNALRAIIDSNATTFIAGAVMYWFGQGDIRGFSVALMVSIIVSLLTAVLLSRMMLLSFTNSGVVKRPWWYGVGKGVLKNDEA
ncbi:protein translocase subunit SecD [Alicyclobacillus dauci]|uniref:Protein translocase subunit SecD n=1 Tax=Alicyclobacillus dauci TaxID=1475485 RepID=A0ABY6Z7D2_9BACL|nr:protein translocase subunit SecD [Alicyclobacillus dauci]WAH38433.1 protein translocase subunit SecD [Alicyclobacillus dauci]